MKRLPNLLSGLGFKPRPREIAAPQGAKLVHPINDAAHFENHPNYSLSETILDLRPTSTTADPNCGTESLRKHVHSSIPVPPLNQQSCALPLIPGRRPGRSGSNLPWH